MRAVSVHERMDVRDDSRERQESDLGLSFSVAHEEPCYPISRPFNILVCVKTVEESLCFNIFPVFLV